MSKSIIGIVTSNKTDKTIVISATTRKTHPLYHKQYTVNTKYMAHDAKNEAEIGDKVEIIECRPISARKRFTLSKIIEKPSLRADSLAVTQTDDIGKNLKDSKKSKEDEPEAPKEEKKS